MYLSSAYVVYFVSYSECTAFKLLSNFMGIWYQRNPSTSLRIVTKVMVSLRIVTKCDYIAYSEVIFQSSEN